MSEKVDIFMPFYVGDYLRDTGDLNTEEHGAYVLILLSMWTAGGTLPAARLDRIARASEARWPAIWEAIGRFFNVQDGVATQKRLLLELEIAKGQKEQARHRGRLSAEARKEKFGTAQPPKASRKPLESVSTAFRAEPRKALETALETAPNPSPSPSPSPSTEDRRGRVPLRVNPKEKQIGRTEFARCYRRYAELVKPDEQNRARQEWKLLAVTYPGGKKGLERAIMAKIDAGLLERHPYDSTDDPGFRPTFAAFLRKRLFDDDVPAKADLGLVRA